MYYLPHIICKIYCKLHPTWFLQSIRLPCCLYYFLSNNLKTMIRSSMNRSHCSYPNTHYYLNHLKHLSHLKLQQYLIYQISICGNLNVITAYFHNISSNHIWITLWTKPASLYLTFASNIILEIGVSAIWPRILFRLGLKYEVIFICS